MPTAGHHDTRHRGHQACRLPMSERSTALAKQWLPRDGHRVALSLYPQPRRKEMFLSFLSVGNHASTASQQSSDKVPKRSRILRPGPRRCIWPRARNKTECNVGVAVRAGAAPTLLRKTRLEWEKGNARKTRRHASRRRRFGRGVCTGGYVGRPSCTYSAGTMFTCVSDVTQNASVRALGHSFGSLGKGTSSCASRSAVRGYSVPRSNGASRNK